MNLNDALRLDLHTLAQHGNTVVIRWAERTGNFVVAACQSHSLESVAFFKHCEYRGEVVASQSLGDAVGYLHDVVMGEDE